MLDRKLGRRLAEMLGRHAAGGQEGRGQGYCVDVREDAEENIA